MRRLSIASAVAHGIDIKFNQEEQNEKNDQCRTSIRLRRDAVRKHGGTDANLRSDRWICQLAVTSRI
jgi:hypothetical protein